MLRRRPSDASRECTPTSIRSRGSVLSADADADPDGVRRTIRRLSAKPSGSLSTIVLVLYTTPPSDARSLCFLRAVLVADRLGVSHANALSSIVNLADLRGELVSWFDRLQGALLVLPPKIGNMHKGIHF